MNYFTTNTYEMKREIINFSKKILIGSSKVESKFVTDMIYGNFINIFLLFIFQKQKSSLIVFIF